MKLRKPCEHGQYEDHYTHNRTRLCPGGVFLPDDTLTDAAWQFNEAVSLLREVSTRVRLPEELGEEIEDQLPGMQSALEALALSVREAE